MHTRFGGRGDVAPGFFLILALPVLVFLISNWVIPHIGVPLPSVTAEELIDPAKGYAEAAGRNRYLGGLMFFTVIVGIAVVAFAAEMLRPLTRRTRIAALVALVLALAPVVGNVLDRQEESVATWRSYHQLGEGVMQAVLAHGEVRLCQRQVTEFRDGQEVTVFTRDPETDSGRDMFLGRPCTDNPVMSLFRFLFDYSIVLSGVGVSCLVLGMILSLARLPGSAPLEQRAFHHGRNQRTARRFLYLAGLMLSTGMFLAVTWMHWPVPLVRDAAAPLYETVINATLFYYGVLYTLLIVAGFGPVMFIAARRADRLALESLAAGAGAGAGAGASEAPTVSRMDEWKAAHGLRVSFTEAIQALIAAASPLLTAFAGSFAPV